MYHFPSSISVERRRAPLRYHRGNLSSRPLNSPYLTFKKRRTRRCVDELFAIYTSYPMQSFVALCQETFTGSISLLSFIIQIDYASIYRTFLFYCQPFFSKKIKKFLGIKKARFRGALINVAMLFLLFF